MSEQGTEVKEAPGTQTESGDKLAEWLMWAGERFAGIPPASLVARIEAEARAALLAEIRRRVEKALPREGWGDDETGETMGDAAETMRAAVLAILTELREKPHG